MAINLQKITIEKQGDTASIDLTKNRSSSAEILINLNWSPGNAKKGFFGKLFDNQAEVDLDLGLFYELNNGEKNCIDGVQFAKGNGGTRDQKTRQGRFTAAPWIWHTGDDRGAAAGSGEDIIVNPKGATEIKRMIIYCFIYDGVAKWAETNGVVTIKVEGNPDIEVQMGQQTDARKFCAIAEIIFSPTKLDVKKLVSFHNFHSDCDKTYNWGMKWTSGGK